MSNLASLGALLGYPFVVEPVFSAHEQVAIWSWLFGAFAVLCGLLAWRSPSAATEKSEVAEKTGNPYFLWLALSATGSVMLLAVTNHLTQNVAAVPLLWLAPLVLYLLSFILTFEGGNWYQPRRLWVVLVVALGAMGWLLADSRFEFKLALQLGVYLAGLFVACVFCHGELYRTRPAPAGLTAFYLTLSAGGALGGLLVAVVAPLVFPAYYELGLGLVFVAVLAAVRLAPFGLVPRYVSLAALLAMAGCAMYDAVEYRKDVSLSTRNFYGVLRVKDYEKPGDAGYLRRLIHGAIMHGEQYQSEKLRHSLTSYYTDYSGIGGAIRSKRVHPANRVGVIGLGAGTIAAYGRKGDTYRFYDINPAVVAIARSEFTYLSDSAARIEIVLGDARLSLEREPPQQFDVLAVDAFSGDAIPVHLITREALGVYLRQVKPDGIVAFHLSNRFLHLIPVVARLAAEQGAQAMLVSDDPDDNEPSPLRSRSDWVLVSKSLAALERPEIAALGAEPPEDEESWRTWTDDYSNLVQILKSSN
jgi:SAM-dependent methyltransferase